MASFLAQEDNRVADRSAGIVQVVDRAAVVEDTKCTLAEVEEVVRNWAMVLAEMVVLATAVID